MTQLPYTQLYLCLLYFYLCMRILVCLYLWGALHIGSYASILLERTQHFASKMCTKTWHSSYNELLDRLHQPTLAQRRLHLSLSFMYRTGYCIFLLILLFLAARHFTTPDHTHFTNLLHVLIHTWTPSYLTLSQWNTLPEYVVASPSLSSFKRNLSPFTL